MSIGSRMLDMVFPHSCAGCRRPDTWLCATCAMNIQQPLHQTLQNAPLRSLFTLGTYTTPALRTTIRTMKFHHAATIARLLGAMIGNALRANPTLYKNAIVCAVPLHRRRQRTRGFDQAEIIGEEMANALGIPFVHHALIRHRATPPQAKLHTQNHLRTTHFDFRRTERKLPATKHILLVDDVITTGATIMAAANALQRNDPHIIHGIAIARPS